MFAIDSCPGIYSAVNSSTFSPSHEETPLKTDRSATLVPGCLTCMSFNNLDTKTKSSGVQGSIKVVKYFHKFVVLVMSPAWVQFNAYSLSFVDSMTGSEAFSTFDHSKYS